MQGRRGFLWYLTATWDIQFTVPCELQQVLQMKNWEGHLPSPPTWPNESLSHFKTMSVVE